MKTQKINVQYRKCSKPGLYVSYRAQNLHAEIFFKGIRVLYRSKVFKIRKNIIYARLFEIVIFGFHGGIPTPW